jgi:hypothetical protein
MGSSAVIDCISTEGKILQKVDLTEKVREKQRERFQCGSVNVK